ncbi:MAG: lipopolysaccharide biosynthesis protein [Methylobacter sp.]|nr:lipopolysaccharide biosynthesis protein [Methylobacter sp.]
MEQHTKTPVDYLEMVTRRKYYILLTWLFVSLASVIIAYNLPKVYRSTATILIEAAIPTKLFEASTSQFAEEQIQSIYQRVMTTDKVLSIIEESGLYNEVKGSTKFQLTELFKKNAEVKLAKSTLTPQTHSGMAEIAFDVSFTDINASKAQEIASKLVTLFIAQNDKARTQRAIKATDFLIDESDKLNKDLQEIDKKIAQYKELNNFSLPEQMQGNLSLIDRTENELRDTDNQIRSTKERIVFLTAELARAQKDIPGSLEKNTPQNREDELRILQAQYLKYSGIYSEIHPSVIRLKREIKALESSFNEKPVAGAIQEQLLDAKLELKLLEETYTANHPDVVQQKKQIEALEQQLKKAPAITKLEGDSVLHKANPAYFGVEEQYKSSQSELQSLFQKKEYLKSKLEKMQAVLLEAPQVEMGYTDLIRERDNAIKKYTQLKEKLLDAKLVQTLEQQQQGQTLTVIEQPVIPEQPEKAIRRNVAIGGFFMGIIAGFGIALLMEYLEPGVRGYRAIMEVTGLMPLVVVPYIESPSEVDRRYIKQGQLKKIIVCTGLTLILLVTVFIFIYSGPLAETFIGSNQ